jgi:hypothetical protein
MWGYYWEWSGMPMSAIHIKIINGQGRRLLELTQYHDRTPEELEGFLCAVERLVEQLAPGKRPKRVE